MIQMFTKKRKKGFTLIELVVVVAILGILAALAIPRLTGSRDSANRKAVIANLRTIESALSIAEADGKLDSSPTVAELVAAGYLAVAPSGPQDGTYTSSYEVFNNATAPDVSYRAGVTFSNATMFGVNAGVGPHTVEDLLGTNGW